MSDDTFVHAHIRKREFDLVLSYIGTPFEGPFDDWPAQAQDLVLEAMATKSHEVGKSLTLDRAGSDVDHDNEGYSFIHIVAVCYEGLH